MSYVKNIVCLANSIKLHPGRCIAGREVSADGKIGGWIRPVGDRPEAHVLPKEFLCDGVSPKLMDIIAVPLLKPVPHAHQTENHLIDASRPWKRITSMSFSRLPELREEPAQLWINNRANDTIDGVSNCLTPEEAATQNYSLTLIRPTDCIAIVKVNPYKGKKQCFARFGYRAVTYVLSLTDPLVTDVLVTKEPGEYPLANIDLCISLAEPNPKEPRRRCSKLVAAVFSPHPL
jgi:hypothetical protein